MKLKWLIPSAGALLVLALVILFSQGIGLAQVPDSDLMVTKSVEPLATSPGNSVLYTVSLSNTSGMTLTLSSLIDVLPNEDFEFAGMAVGSDISTPPTENPPELEWMGPITVPMSETLLVRYWVWVADSVPLSPVPYTNTVTAYVDAAQYSAEAGLQVSLGEASLLKVAEPDAVEPGALVTYTVTFSNSGYSAMAVAVVTDVLPTGVEFVTMTTGSDVLTAPVGVTETLVWTGPFVLAPHGELNVEYIAAMPPITESQILENEAWGRMAEGELLGPASAVVHVSPAGPSTILLPFVVRHYAPPAFALSKAANPTEAYAEEPAALITYTVVVENRGTVPGILADIRDTLPAGFTFVQMMPGSDVSTAPTGTTGQIVWNGPFVLDGESSLTLIYQVQASTAVGTYVNTVTATPTEGRLINETATSTVTLLEPFFLIEDFENPDPYWEPFTNYWRLNDQQWHLKPGGSNDGSTALGHTFWFGVSDPEDGAHDALYMYEKPEADLWTDYIFQTKAILYFDDGSQRGQFGVWFRGTYEPGTKPGDGRRVTGYYFTLRPGPPMEVLLLQLRTEDECGDDCSANYHFSNPLLLEKLRGHDDLDPLGLSIDLGRWYWLKVVVEGPRIRCYIDNVEVFDYYDNVGTTFSAGTVGFYTYIAGDARFDHVTVEPLN